MGHTNTKTSHDAQHFDLDKYERVGKLWRHRTNPLGQPQLQQHFRLIQSHPQLQHQLEVFRFRKQAPHLVGALHLSYQQQDEFCSRFFRRRLFVEHMPLRLSDIPSLPLQDSLYVMAVALNGFKQLYDEFGYFTVTQKMIAIDRNGIVRVWLNENFGSADYDEVLTVGTEKEMAIEVVRLVWAKTDKRQKQSPYQFMLGLRRNGELDLKLAFYAIVEYALKHNIKYSRQVSSVLPLLSQLKSGLSLPMAQITSRRNSLESRSKRESPDKRFAQSPTMFTTATNTTNSNLSQKPKLNTSRSVDRGLQKSPTECMSEQSEAPSRIPSCIQPSLVPRLNLDSKVQPILFRPPTTRARLPCFNPFQKPPMKPASTYRFSNATNRLPDLLVSQIQSSKDFLGSMKHIGSTKNLKLAKQNFIQTPTKYKFLKEVPSSPTIQFSNKLLKAKSPTHNSRRSDEDKKCRVIDVDTVDSPIKRRQQSLQVNQRDDSIYFLLDSLQSQLH